MSWPDVKKINSDLNTPLDELIKTEITQLQTTMVGGNIPVVKGVQYGRAKFATTTSLTIAINEVNPKKCLVILGYYDTDILYLSNLSATAISVKCSTNVAVYVPWFVVEFY